MLTAESKRDDVHAAKVRKTKEQSSIISVFKTYVPPIIGGMVEGKESTTPLMEILTPEWWNYHDGLIGVHSRASKSFQEQRLKLQEGINI